MNCNNAINKWAELKQKLSSCQKCYNYNGKKLVELGAHPLFEKNNSCDCKILFILEAPNADDTYNPNKGYVTINPDTDPSGKFFFKLFSNELKLPIKELHVTNSVLCLPINRKKPSSKMIKMCSNNLKKQIEILDPLIVVTIGGTALDAIRKIEDHGIKSLKQGVAKETSWFSRILFPLYHTGLQARNGPTGRTERQQREDWRKLRQIFLRQL